MSVKFSNNATTELASAIGTSDTSITVVDASKFPILTAGDYTYVTLDTDTASPTREIVKVTAISGNVLTVTRGMDGTSPASFAAGTKVELRLTAALLNDVAGANPSGEPIGFPDKSQTTITFDSGTRTFSITPTGASFDVYCKGVKYTYTTVQLVTIPNTTGLHFIYFDASGVLSTQMSYFTWEEHAPTAYVYWNATTQQAVYFGDERHGITLDWQTHEYLHRTRGAAIASGFSASNYTTTGLGATDADAQIDIGGGTFFDEDMQVDIVSTNTPVAGTWQQDLAGPARIPVLYLSGSAWVIDAPTNFPFKVVSGIPQYNLYSSGTWSTASVTNNSYFVSWILATNNLTYPVVSIISQAPTNQLSVAEAMTFEGLNLNGFPSVEFRPLYKVIYQYKEGFTNSVKSSTIAVYDLRSLQSAGVAAALVQDHGNLSGLVDDDHPQYVHVSEVRTPSAAVKNSFFPSQVGQTGKYLSTDGTNTVWEPAPSGSLSFTGDVTGTGSTGSSVSLTLAASGVVAGQYTKVTVDAKGRVTAATSIASSDVTTALGYTPYNSSNPAGYLTGITGTQVTTALGYTPYNSSNPSGYITSSALSSYLPLSGGTLTGALRVQGLGTSNPTTADGTDNSILSLRATDALVRLQFGTRNTGNYAGWIQASYDNGGGANGVEPLELNPLGGTVNANGSAVLHAGNYNSYSPTLTGAGASGTWGISVTGSSTSVSYGGYTFAGAGNGEATSSGWVGFPNGQGIWSSVNGAHLKPNQDGTYGAWHMYGSRNGWHGIYFGSGSTLMMASSDVGFYRDGIGWQMRWSSGTGYIHKGSTGGGTESTILDSSNYSSYSLPLSGGTITGDVGIGAGFNGFNSISGTERTLYIANGNAASLYLHATGGSGRKYALFSGASGSLAIYDVNAGAYRLQLDTSAANFSVALQQGGNQVLHAANYNSYAPTLTGTGASGTWGINVTGNAATVSSITSGQVTAALGYTPLALAGLAGQTSAATGSVAGGGGRWLRVATLGTNWFYGRVKIWDGSSSGPHQSKEFTVSGAFNDRSKVSFVLLAGGSYNYVGVSKVRYLSATTYDPQYLEVYIDGAGSDSTWTVAIFEPRNASAVGFSTGSVPSGYTSVEWDCNGAFAAGSAAGGFRIGYDNSAFVNGNTVLHAGNYNDYAPSKTGTGANGTWNISVTGNAATVTNGIYRNTTNSGWAYLTSSTQGTPILRLNQEDTGSGYYLLQGLTGGSEVMRIERSGTIVSPTGRFQKNQTAGDYTTAALWTESYGNTATGIAFHISGNVGKFLEMRTNGILYWNSDILLHTGNYNSYSLPLSGGTVSGATNFSSGITVNNASADGRGINLYSGSPTSPTYGLFFAQTGNFGTYGSVHADWATYFTMNSTLGRGWVFRDVESLGNVAAISNQGNMTIRSHFEQGNNIARPNVSWSASSNSTGMVIFYLPGTTANYGMIHMVFDIYEYNGNAVSTVVVGGHNWSTSWYNVGANVIGQCGKEVRLGVKNGRFCVVFGTSGSVWEYGTIVLRKIHNGSFYDNIMNMVGDWESTQTTTESFTNITGDLRALRTPASFNAGGAITQAGNQVLHAGNYTSYAPSLTGSGASGTWGINITGSAGSAGNVGGYTSDGWLRKVGDSTQFQIYGNSRTIVFRTDGVTNPHGGGGYPYIWFYGGSGDSERRMILNTDGQLWLSNYGWLHDYFLQKSGSALSGTTSFNGTMLFPSGGGGVTFGANHYSMGKDVANGSWTHPHYADLIIGYHTGIRIGAAYSGIRFYNNSPTTDANNDGNGDQGEALLMTIGGHAAGSGVIVNNSLTAYGSVNANDVYTTGGWFRNHTNNNGIYWSATGWHLYPANAGNFYVRSGQGDGSLHFLNSSGSSLGYVHAASDAAMGFLTTGGSWRFRVDNSGNARCYNNLYLDQNYGHGIVGAYSSVRYQGVFAMGDSYKLPADGTSAGNLYGLAWSYPSAGGVAGNLDSHGLLVLINGGLGSAISYSIVAAGNVTAYSDERLKTNWREMPTNFVERLASVRVGIYDRTDGEQITQVGVSAQSLREVLPEAVNEAKDEMRTLSVSYGNAAMASAVELAKEIVMLKKELAELKSRLH